MGASEPALRDITSKPVKAVSSFASVQVSRSAFTDLLKTSRNAGSVAPIPSNVGENSSFYQPSNWDVGYPNDPGSLFGSRHCPQFGHLSIF